MLECIKASWREPRHSSQSQSNWSSTIKLLWVPFAVALALLLANTAQAAIIWDLGGTQNAVTLAEVNQAGGIIVGDKLFSDFVVTPSSTIGAQSPDYGITVRGINVGGELGLNFFGGWTAFQNQIVDTTIKFKVSIMPPEVDQGWLIVDNSLTMLAYGAAGSGQVAITENVYSVDPDTVANPGLFKLADKYVYYNTVSSQTYDHKEFTQGLTEIWVVKDVVASGGVEPGGSASISNFRQTFSQIPEPASFMLLSSGVLLIVGRRRQA